MHNAKNKREKNQHSSRIVMPFNCIDVRFLLDIALFTIVSSEVDNQMQTIEITIHQIISSATMRQWLTDCRAFALHTMLGMMWIMYCLHLTLCNKIDMYCVQHSRFCMAKKLLRNFRSPALSNRCTFLLQFVCCSVPVFVSKGEKKENREKQDENTCYWVCLCLNECMSRRWNDCLKI